MRQGKLNPLKRRHRSSDMGNSDFVSYLFAPKWSLNKVFRSICDFYFGGKMPSITNPSQPSFQQTIKHVSTFLSNGDHKVSSDKIHELSLKIHPIIGQDPKNQLAPFIRDQFLDIGIKLKHTHSINLARTLNSIRQTKHAKGEAGLAEAANHFPIVTHLGYSKTENNESKSFNSYQDLFNFCYDKLIQLSEEKNGFLWVSNIFGFGLSISQDPQFEILIQKDENFAVGIQIISRLMSQLGRRYFYDEKMTNLVIKDFFNVHLHIRYWCKLIQEGRLDEVKKRPFNFLYLNIYQKSGELFEKLLAVSESDFTSFSLLTLDPDPKLSVAREIKFDGDNWIIDSNIYFVGIDGINGPEILEKSQSKVLFKQIQRVRSRLNTDYENATRSTNENIGESNSNNTVGDQDDLSPNLKSLFHLKTGEDVLKVIGGAYASNVDLRSVTVASDREFLENFTDTAKEIGEFYSELDYPKQSDAIAVIDQALEEIHGKGYQAFGEKLKLPYSPSPDDANKLWPVAHLCIVPKDSDRIARTNEGEPVAVFAITPKFVTE